MIQGDDLAASRYEQFQEKVVTNMLVQMVYHRLRNQQSSTGAVLSDLRGGEAGHLYLEE